MERPNRKLPRLANYVYASDGYYFITICTHDKQYLFGSPDNLSQIGLIAEREVIGIPAHYENVDIDLYVVMPNHIHCIVVIEGDGDAERASLFPTLSTIVGSYKAGVTRSVRAIYPDIVVWQKSFYDSVLRSERGYLETCRYIEENPARWLEDEYY